MLRMHTTLATSFRHLLPCKCAGPNPDNNLLILSLQFVYTVAAQYSAAITVLLSLPWYTKRIHCCLRSTNRSMTRTTRRYIFLDSADNYETLTDDAYAVSKWAAGLFLPLVILGLYFLVCKPLLVCLIVKDSLVFTGSFRLTHLSRPALFQ